MSKLNPILSASPVWASIGDAFSWITVENDIKRELYAQAVYNVNNGNNYSEASDGTVSNTLGTILSANPVRKALYCRNLSTNSELFIKLGEGASDSSFHIILKHSDDGVGELFFDEQVYKGAVSVYSEDPVYLMWEGY